MPHQMEFASKKGIFVGRTAHDIIEAALIAYIPHGCIQIEVGPDVNLIGCYSPTEPSMLEEVKAYVKDRLHMEPKVYHIYQTITLVEVDTPSPH